MIVKLPQKDIEIKYLVLDYNGTIAKDGTVKKEVFEILEKLKNLEIYVLTADTHGSAYNNLKHTDINLHILTSNDHTKEKGEFVENLGYCFAVGNGANDALMLQKAQIGVCVIEEEGACVKTLLNADIVCKSIVEALELLVYPKRITATLRV